jgi:hypothetical protein
VKAAAFVSGRHLRQALRGFQNETLREAGDHLVRKSRDKREAAKDFLTTEDTEGTEGTEAGKARREARGDRVGGRRSVGADYCCVLRCDDAEAEFLTAARRHGEEVWREMGLPAKPRRREGWVQKKKLGRAVERRLEPICGRCAF